jgi:hypothetical protein
MGLETGSYLADLNTANPSGTDPKSQGDDHIRLIKTVAKNSFPGFGGVVVGAGVESGSGNAYTVTLSPAPASYASLASTLVLFRATHANTGAATLQINALGTKTLKDVNGGALASGDVANGAMVAAFYDGTDFFLVTPNDRSARSGDTYTGAHDFTGATVDVPTAAAGDADTTAASTAFVDTSFGKIAGQAWTGTHTFPTQSPGDNSTKAATTAFATQLAFQATLPAQAGGAGKFLQTDGASASWNWAGFNGRFTKSANFTIGFDDKEKLFCCTSTITAAIDTVATLGLTHAVLIQNGGVGEITLDPSGSETIDGLPSLIMYPGEMRLLFNDGLALLSQVISPFVRQYTASGTFVMPPGYAAIAGDGVGGGGGGGGAASGDSYGGGGGAGARLAFRTVLAAGASNAVVIGAGGSAGTGVAGGAGGNSSFAGRIFYGGGGGQVAGAPASGGGGGGGASAGGAGGAGGQPRPNSLMGAAGTAPDIIGLGGGAGGNGIHQAGGNAEWGGGGGGCSDGNNIGVGGSSIFGPGGGGAGGGNGGGLGSAGGASGSYYPGGGGAGGAAAANGTAGTVGNLLTSDRCGMGGGGGGGPNPGVTIGGTGGAGGACGGGGGGGGYGGTGATSGGVGGRGEVVIRGII